MPIVLGAHRSLRLEITIDLANSGIARASCVIGSSIDSIIRHAVFCTRLTCPDEPLILVSCHFPFVPLNAPDQFALPALRLCPADLVHGSSRIACDPAWNALI
ncbi:hypothetical protein JYT11_00845 [Planctomycetaceae bacterium AH-315-I19]|nr:hypothetical protein [Planctomycetaceae bacterium AH-315-I19]